MQQLLNLLEVNELGLVGVKQEAAAVVAHWVAADGGLRVLKLLLHVLDDALAIKAQEGATHQLGVHRVCAYHLPADAHQRAYAQRGQLTDPGEPRHRESVRNVRNKISHCVIRAVNENSLHVITL